ncbi:hypothetical protein AB0L00_23515 [Actinoallomurus sp. NPDC052308]|uniref:hypothetical protein n=1 Tax=Actinoallomurus sp. NPDC052308 TaxID=3155530 RepID=UPI00341EDD1B
MCKDDRSAVRCPTCHTSLVLAAIGGGPSPVLALRDPPSPPPVHEVLAQYAGRAVDPATARSGAAQVRASLTAARAAAAQRRARQAEARRAGPDVRGVPHRAA